MARASKIRLDLTEPEFLRLLGEAPEGSYLREILDRKIDREIDRSVYRDAYVRADLSDEEKRQAREEWIQRRAARKGDI